MCVWVRARMYACGYVRVRVLIYACFILCLVQFQNMYGRLSQTVGGRVIIIVEMEVTEFKTMLFILLLCFKL